ncbi:DgyrCDS8926 [Dimorphilus gyrociliatus]|uniref:DgyrCDS8926 n=1 Tax=Dimorphilus gyrociliatus TaxID=2664684 RepID=A0A7I8VVS5_9ANNE|nr:DgyrCDS8926 [Dimorphilus gyrociliatus]
MTDNCAKQDNFEDFPDFRPDWDINDPYFTEFLNIPADFSAGDLLSIDDDLIPKADELCTDVNMSDAWRLDASDSSDSGLETCIKQEPLSPTNSNCSESSLDSGITPAIQGAGKKTTIAPNVPIAPRVVQTNPITPKATTVVKVEAGGTQQQLILRPEELAHLAKTGQLISVSQPVIEKKSVAQQPSVNDVQLRALKKQQRMIKNRESACLSRKRKKEYMTSLEERLKQTHEENMKLARENADLKERLNSTQQENLELKKKMLLTSDITNKKKGVAVFGVLLLFTFNMAYFFIPINQQQSQILSERHAGGRSILSYNDEPPYKNNAFSFLKSNDELKRITAAIMPIDQSIMCPKSFNATESQRLANELRGWVLNQKEAQKTPQKARKVYRKKLRFKKQPYPIQLFSNADRFQKRLLEAIARRNDTFYVVSFAKDNLLLPATAHNKTMRPRMSLVMPASNLNDTLRPPQGSVAMMQIDCEVMATRLLHLDTQYASNSTSQPSAP